MCGTLTNISVIVAYVQARVVYDYELLLVTTYDDINLEAVNLNYLFVKLH